MKSTVNNTAVIKEMTFPRLMILPSTGTIILARRLNNSSGQYYGIVVVSKTQECPVGTLSNNFSSKFKDFEDSVTLSND